MTEITLQLTDEQARLLLEEARQKNTTPETIATQLLSSSLAERMPPGQVMSDQQFQESLDRTLKENLELLKRLA